MSQATQKVAFLYIGEDVKQFVLGKMGPLKVSSKKAVAALLRSRETECQLQITQHDHISMNDSLKIPVKIKAPKIKAYLEKQKRVD